MEEDPPMEETPLPPPPPGYDFAVNSPHFAPPSLPKPPAEVVKYSEISQNARAVDHEG